jgi:hypothetical protein
MILVDSAEELRILHRSLMASRFGKSQDDPVLMGSPLLAEVHVQVLEMLIAQDPFGSRLEWEQWRMFGKHEVESEVVVASVSREDNFFTMSVDDQRSYLRICVAPFVASDEEIELLRERCVRERAEMSMPD